MKYAKLENGILTIANKIHTSDGSFDASVDDAPEGWQRIEDSTSADEIDSDDFPVLSKRQITLALFKLGITDAMVKAVINKIPDPISKATAEIYWDTTTSFHRDHPLVAQLAVALNIKESILDDTWNNAPSLDN